MYGCMMKSAVILREIKHIAKSPVQPVHTRHATTVCCDVLAIIKKGIAVDDHSSRLQVIGERLAWPWKDADVAEFGCKVT